MSRPMKLAQRTALITGAASGIGRAIALSLARRGCHLALADIDAAGLAQTATLAAPHGVQVTCHHLDVADAAAVAALPAAVQADHAGVDLLVNNAGVALNGTFAQFSDEEFEWLFAINFHGVVRMTRAFLPLLQASDDARLVNLSSVFGLVAPPGQSAYAASKFAVRGFSEALRHELQGSTVGVTVVHPGGVATAIAAKARTAARLDPAEAARQIEEFQKLLKLPPEVAGETIVKGMEQRQARVLVGSDAKLIALIVRLAPVGYWRLLERLL
ncbi:MAG: SDR family oxidoreductase [Caldilineaceae bacterium]